MGWLTKRLEGHTVRPSGYTGTTGSAARTLAALTVGWIKYDVTLSESNGNFRVSPLYDV